MIRRRGSAAGNRRERAAAGRLWFVGVGLCNGLAVLLLYAALAHGPVALVSPLVATYPLVTVAGSAFILGRNDGGARLALAVALTVAGRRHCCIAG